ncbi:hypothetical protein ACIRP7_27525 [Streptomyces sp. NPDC102270]|uniref:hypothetical protein n=1 Tax=Streptomyces sp. NPDC102270 TaxID=3366150 RepID=UPI0038200CFD
MDQGDAGEKLCGGKGQEDSGAEQIAGDDQGTFASAVGQDPGVKGQQQGGSLEAKAISATLKVEACSSTTAKTDSAIVVTPLPVTLMPWATA